MKKLFFLTFSLFCLVIISRAQNIAINTDGSTADASSMLDVKSTSKGMLVPRMTTAQRMAIVSPASGLLVYDTDAKSFWFYNGTAWTSFSSPVSTATNNLPIDTVGNFNVVPIQINNLTPGFTSPIMRVYNTAGVGVHAVSQTNDGISGLSSATTGSGVYGNHNGTGIGSGVRGISTNGYGVKGISSNTSGVYGLSGSGTGGGVFGESTSNGIGVKGESEFGKGVYGAGFNNGIGVEGWNGANGIGVSAIGNTNMALYARANGTTGISAKFEQFNSSGKALVVNGNLSIAGGNTSPGTGKVLTSDANGNATWQTQGVKVGFKLHDSYPGGANVFAENTWYRVFFENEVYDYNNNITTGNTSANSAFTAPVAGLYHFDAAIQISRYGLEVNLALVKIAANGTETLIARTNSPETLTLSPGIVGGGPTTAISTDIKLAVGEKIIVKAFWSNGYHSGSSYTHASIPNTELNLGQPMATYFTGHLVFSN